jgi:hypothetical protein
VAATDVTRSREGTETARSAVRRRTTETKAGIRTTEFYAYLAALAGIMIAGLVTKAGTGHADRLISKQVWLYATILTVGYMVARGLAKSGSREPYNEDTR